MKQKCQCTHCGNPLDDGGHGEYQLHCKECEDSIYSNYVEYPDDLKQKIDELEGKWEGCSCHDPRKLAFGRNLIKSKTERAVSIIEEMSDDQRAELEKWVNNLPKPPEKTMTNPVCGKEVVIPEFRCVKDEGHEGGCHGEMSGAPTKFGPEYNLTWSEESTVLWQKIWYAVEHQTILALSREEVDRLGGMLWNIGVFK